MGLAPPHVDEDSWLHMVSLAVEREGTLALEDVDSPFSRRGVLADVGARSHAEEGDVELVGFHDDL